MIAIAYHISGPSSNRYERPHHTSVTQAAGLRMNFS